MSRDENVPNIYTPHHLTSLVHGLDENLGEEYVRKLSSVQNGHFVPILGTKMSLGIILVLTKSSLRNILAITSTLVGGMCYKLGIKKSRKLHM